MADLKEWHRYTIVIDCIVTSEQKAEEIYEASLESFCNQEDAILDASSLTKTIRN